MSQYERIPNKKVADAIDKISVEKRRMEQVSGRLVILPMKRRRMQLEHVACVIVILFNHPLKPNLSSSSSIGDASVALFHPYTFTHTHTSSLTHTHNLK